MNSAAVPPSPPGRGAGGEGHSQKLALPIEILAFARELHSKQTSAETMLWNLLRSRRFLGLKFRRQHAVPPYVLDFYCDELQIAVELDGGQHNEDGETQRDARRAAYLAERNIEVIRYWNHDLMLRTEAVLEDLMTRLSMKPRPSPDAVASTSPEGRGKRASNDE